jgi:DNA-binding MarR family transcriptional regulator
MCTTSNLSPAALIVYETLKRVTQNNICTLSYQMLIKTSGYGKTTVVQAIKELEWKEWIRKQTHQGVWNGCQANGYELLKNILVL